MLAPSIEKVTIEYDNIKYSLGGTGYKMNNLFYRTFNCKACGRCCTSANAFLVMEPEDLLPENSHLFKEITVKINGESHTLLTSTIKCNKFIQPDGRCLMYQNRSITCRAPHIFLDYSTKHQMLYLHKRQYMRNWAMGCKSIQEPYTWQSLDEDLQTLKYIQTRANTYNIPNYYNEIINQVETEGRKFLNKQETLEHY